MVVDPRVASNFLECVRDEGHLAVRQAVLLFFCLFFSETQLITVFNANFNRQFLFKLEERQSINLSARVIRIM